MDTSKIDFKRTELYLKAIKQITEYWDFKTSSGDDETTVDHFDIGEFEKEDGEKITTDRITAQYATTVIDWSRFVEDEINDLENIMEQLYSCWGYDLQIAEDEFSEMENED